MEIDPALVIEACSKRLQTAAITERVRAESLFIRSRILPHPIS
jgi:hypothetical protein